MRNRLHTSSSLYLKQHASNPVHWQPWDEEALRLAQESNKLIIVSIGYAACHWCHVMEHESFSDSGVAELMNRNFVCIKVDREERPDIDQQYMAAVQLINGNGGWPLNCITLPDGKPVFGGTYFRRNDWMMLLERLVSLWESSPDELRRHAGSLTDGVAGYENIGSDLHNRDITVDDFEKLTTTLLTQIDVEQGGTRGAPKFPMPAMIRLLFALAENGINEESQSLALLTLQKMQQGGIHDHLGGGFARYAVDSTWRIPHFEKMLYDNAQLLSLYSKAFAASGELSFRDTAYGILNFLDVEMRSGDRGFYAAIDADSEGEEGRFYTWTADEIKSCLGKDAGLFMQYYNCKQDGNFEAGRNALYTLQPDEKFWNESDIDQIIGVGIISRSRNVLLKQRSERIRPATDQKQITSWNALLVSSMVEMAMALDDSKVLDSASDLADTILKYAVKKDGTIMHLFGEGDAAIDGFLDDYAALLIALTDLYSATFNKRYLRHADELIRHVISNFPDDKTGLFYFIENSRHFPVARKMELHDHVTPSSNSMMALALFRMSFYVEENTFREQYQRMAGNLKSRMMQNPASHSFWALSAIPLVKHGWEITVSGKGAVDAAMEISSKRYPGMLIKVSDGDSPGGTDKPDGPLTIIPCKNRTCHTPLNNPEELSLFLKTFQE